MSTKALERYLAPFVPILNASNVTEVCINNLQEVYIERNGNFDNYIMPELEYEFLETLAGLIAEFNNKDFPIPLLSGSLPTGERVQIVMNPACENQKLIFAIRRQQMRDICLDEYKAAGSFYHVEKNKTKVDSENDKQLSFYYRTNDILPFIKLAIRLKKNILISGGTGTGKTTFLNSCLKVLPKNERIITIEDTREVKVGQANAVHLLFNEDDERITASNMFKTCLRLRPDRIFLSEIRGAEVWPFLRAANSGHPGSLSTVHADTPDGAFTQLVFMMQQAGSTSSEDQIRNYVKSIIDIVIQLKRDSSAGRHMYISEIYFNAVN